MLLEYDCFPILAIYVENGKRYFCNGTELRTYERIVAYPATASQLIRVLTNGINRKRLNAVLNTVA